MAKVAALFNRYLLWSLLVVFVSVGMLPARGFAQGGYPLGKLPLLRLSLRLLKRMYVDPTQFSSEKMYKKALRALSNQVDEFWYEFSKDKKQLFVRLGTHKKTFAVGHFLGLFDVWIKMQEIAGWLESRYKGPHSFRLIEQSITTGVLSTLDKQTRVKIRQFVRSRRRGGASGKIGVILLWREGRLMIGGVAPDGPAEQAGLKKGDQIVRIDGVEIKGRDVGHWIGMIKGLRGSRVALHIQRKGRSVPFRVVLTRSHIPVPNVSGFALPGRIGYLRLRQFDGGSSLQLREELARLRRKVKGSLLGLILDLRNNPGGRVSEAVKIASLFLEKGEVVTYAGANTKRRTYKVEEGNTEELYPLVILLNGYSASASELLSGALQNHGRALIMGRQSYGKGTVQVMGYLRRAEAMYRVTIAQYMLPGDASIQAVGISPDVELQPVYIGKKRIRYFGTRLSDLETRKERWPSFLQQNLDRKGSTWARVSYLSNVSRQATGTSKKTKKKTDPKAWMFGLAPAGPDFGVWFARYLLVHSSSGKRRIFFEQAKPHIRKIRRLQEAEIVRALGLLGIDWRMPRRLKKKTRLAASVELLDGKMPLKTGKSFRLRVKIRNLGGSAAYRVRALLFAQTWPFKHREFLFGKIGVGKEVVRERRFKLPLGLASRKAILRFVYSAKGAQAPGPTRFLLSWRSPRPPVFAISTQLFDRTPDGNGDGRIQAGERVHLRFTIENRGPRVAPALGLFVQISEVQLRKHLISIGKLAPGGRRTFEIPFRVPDNLKPQNLSSRFLLFDRKLGVRVSHRLHLSVEPPFMHFTKSGKGSVVLLKRAPLLASPLRSGEIIAWGRPGTRLLVLRRYEEYVKVRLPGGIFGKPLEVPCDGKQLKIAVPSRRRRKLSHGLVKKREGLVKKKKRAMCAGKKLPLASAWVHRRWLGKKGVGAGGEQGVSLQVNYEPPSISVFPEREPVVASNARYTLALKITSSNGIRDLYVVQKKRKVFYKPIQYLRPGGQKQLTVQIPLRLVQGSNPLRITVRTAQGRFHRRLLISYVPKVP